MPLGDYRGELGSLSIPQLHGAEKSEEQKGKSDGTAGCTAFLSQLGLDCRLQGDSPLQERRKGNLQCSPPPPAHRAAGHGFLCARTQELPRREAFCPSRGVKLGRIISVGQRGGGRPPELAPWLSWCAALLSFGLGTFTRGKPHGATRSLFSPGHFFQQKGTKGRGWLLLGLPSHGHGCRFLPQSRSEESPPVSPGHSHGGIIALTTLVPALLQGTSSCDGYEKAIQQRSPKGTRTSEHVSLAHISSCLPPQKL